MDPRPVMWTLTPSDQKDRRAAWRELWASGLVGRDRVPGGIRLSAEPGANEALMRLIDLERECCAGIDHEVDGSAVTMRAETARRCSPRCSSLKASS